MNPAGEASPTVAREIALGEHDQTLSNWAEALSGWLKPSEDTVDRRLYLNFAPEMNGDWVPWDASDGDTTSQDYVEMWQRVHGRLAEEDLDEDTVQWVWAVNNVGRASYSVSDFYPGDEYVDWTGVHGYNWYQWGEWTPVEVIFDSMIGQLRELSDNPIAISEYGCSAKVKDGYDTERKGEWIQKAADYFEENDVRMASWFNHLEETDWGVFGGEYGTETFEYNGKTYNAYSEYRDIAQRDSFISAHPTHPRGLTGDEFRGEL
jgi:beta-mannanase